MSYTPVAGAYQVLSGGTAIQSIPPGVNGGYIVNPLLATDQGIATAEVLYVDPVSSPGLTANITTVGLQPGQSYDVIAGSTRAVWVNAVTGGHKFTVVYY